MQEKIALEITEKDYKKLVELIYLGVVLHHTYDDKEYKTMHRAEQAIYAQAHKFNAQNLIRYIPELKKYDVTHELMDRMDLFRSSYDYNSFYDELISRLSEKEFMNFYSFQELKTMNQKQKDEALQFIIEKYDSAAKRGGLEKILEHAKDIL